MTLDKKLYGVAIAAMAVAVSVAVAMALALSGCAHKQTKHHNAQRSAYIVGSTVKTFIDEVHAEYDSRVQAKLAECDPQLNPKSTVSTKSELDVCMTPPYAYKAQEAVVGGLAVYVAVSTTFSAVLIGCQPSADGTPVHASTCIKKLATDDELRAWRSKIVYAAMQVLRYFPDAEQKTAQLAMLVGKE